MAKYDLRKHCLILARVSIQEIGVGHSPHYNRQGVLLLVVTRNVVDELPASVLAQEALLSGVLQPGLHALLFFILQLIKALNLNMTCAVLLLALSAA